MPHDLLIKNGTLVDGTGKPRFDGDVAVSNGRITAIGKVDGAAATVIDASSKIVCPGFIDPHTHYDPQISWDPLLSASSEHGITTVIMGNCGVGVAPCRPGDRDLLIEDLMNVEGMAREVLQAGIKWQWETFPQYLDAAEKNGSGINLAFMVPLAPLRTYVMGEASSERGATADETRVMTAILEEAMEAGAWGWSSTMIPSHIGYKAKPFAARLASRDELAAYCGVLRKLDRGTIELALAKRFASFADDEYELLDFLLTHSERPITWLSLHNLREKPDGVAEVLAKADPLIKRRGVPQIMTRSLLSELTFKRPTQFSEFKAIQPVFNQPIEKQMAVYADRDFRKALQEEIDRGSKLSGVLPRIGVYKAQREDLRQYEGRTVGDLAREHQCSDLDFIFDLVLEDRVATKFIVPRTNTNHERIPELLRESDRTLIGLSDGGAHVDMFCEAGYTTYMLGYWVRDQNALTMEHAVKRMTSEPAAFFGIKDRGCLQTGLAADIVVFDPARIGSPARGTMVHDLPAGGARMVSPAQGVEKVIVNGSVLFDDGKHTGQMPGQVLRCW